MSLKEKLLAKTTIAETASLAQSKVFELKDCIITDTPALNIALSGEITGGMGPGILQIAGESRMFKSKFALEISDHFVKKFPEGIVLVYDSEFGTPESYYNGLIVDNYIHSPVVDLEQLKIDIVNQIAEVSTEEKDKLLIIVDSLGNLESVKQHDDALKGKVVTDMTRAKVIRSLFRLVGPRIALKDIYMIVINHSYKQMDQYLPDKVSGGGGTIYNSNGIWMITSEKEKDKAKKNTIGFEFKIKIEKSRFVLQEKRIPITVRFDSGIYQWSGLLELAIESGHIVRPTLQKYAFKGELETLYKIDEIEGNDKFFEKLLKTDFPKWIKDHYQYKDTQ